MNRFQMFVAAVTAGTIAWLGAQASASEPDSAVTQKTAPRKTVGAKPIQPSNPSTVRRLSGSDLAWLKSKMPMQTAAALEQKTAKPETISCKTDALREALAQPVPSTRNDVRNAAEANIADKVADIQRGEKP